jgi:glycosyltransferase involved in cell wall biosynthesis
LIRLLLIIPTLVRGGAEKQLMLLATRLPRDEFDVHVAVLTHTGPLEATLREAGIEVTIIGKRWKFDPLCYSRLRRHIQSLKPDIVHTWLFAANAYGRQAAFGAGVKHVIAGERCVDPWKASWQLAIDRALAPRTERIVTNSSGVKDFYVSRGLPAEKFVIIPNAIDAASDVTPTMSRESLLAGLTLPLDARLVGAVGRLWPQKRLKDLIWAAELLKSTRDGAHLLIIGDGPQRSRLERYRDQNDLQDCVHFLGECDDVPRLIPHFDVLWLASEYEGQSNAIMEAMAASVPVIATDIPGNRDLVVNDVTGCLVPVGDRFEFTRRTDWLLNDESLRRRFGTAGRERIMREFTIEKMVERHAELYRQLASDLCLSH